MTCHGLRSFRRCASSHDCGCHRCCRCLCRHPPTADKSRRSAKPAAHGRCPCARLESQKGVHPLPPRAPAARVGRARHGAQTARCNRGVTVPHRRSSPRHCVIQSCLSCSCWSPTRRSSRTNIRAQIRRELDRRRRRMLASFDEYLVRAFFKSYWRCTRGARVRADRLGQRRAAVPASRRSPRSRPSCPRSARNSQSLSSAAAASCTADATAPVDQVSDAFEQHFTGDEAAGLQRHGRRQRPGGRSGAVCDVPGRVPRDEPLPSQRFETRLRCAIQSSPSCSSWSPARRSCRAGTSTLSGSQLGRRRRRMLGRRLKKPGRTCKHYPCCSWTSAKAHAGKPYKTPRPRPICGSCRPSPRRMASPAATAPSGCTRPAGTTGLPGCACTSSVLWPWSSPAPALQGR